ncbi:pyruvate kinase [Candidatus Peribacteria bacterium]|nr:pyruvate kinase [Candidatus Peribacteria bacterium]
MRFTKIVATLGPATCSTENIERLAKAGVNVCRLNFSHGDYAVHGQTIENIKSVNKKGFSLGIMLDTKGPEVRTGDVKQPIKISAGEKVVFAFKPGLKQKMKVITVDYPKFSDDVRHARCILIDNGAIEFSVLKIEKNGSVIAKALEEGTIGSRRHVNLPGAHISLPSFTEKDWSDIRFGIERGVDFFATSFVRTGKDIKMLKVFLHKHKSEGEIIAKIETPQAVDNIDDIIDASDGIMVARGDLGAEVPFEQVPAIQEMIVAKCREKSKPVIVATHMLESMILSPMPTRAEVTDIAFAAKLQTDSTMLSGETTTGLYPFKAVAAMDRILRVSERVELRYREKQFLSFQQSLESDLPRREQALAASVLATKLRADAIISISKHGNTARAISHCRPLVPIHAFVEEDSMMRKLMLVWGIVPHSIDFSDEPEVTLNRALALFLKQPGVKRGDRIVIVSDIRTNDVPVMTIQIRTIS